jgi:hypothetical protein
MEENAVDRLEAKSPEEAIIARIGRDFNLAPFMARTQFEQMRRYFEQYLGLERDVGQMTMLALSSGNPPGRPVAECKRVPINLSMDTGDDLVALRQGVADLRRSKIQRLTREAQDQGALLTQEDLARLLCTSRSTVKRDIANLRSADIDVPTRGQIKDIGKGLSHKTWIVSDWLAGYTFSEIKRRRRHSLGSIERYCMDFQRVARLHAHGLSVEEIRVSSGLSERLIQEHLQLFEGAGLDNDRLMQLLKQPSRATKEHVEAKRGDWLR